MAGIKAIQDAIVSKVATVTGFSATTVKPFRGSVAELFTGDARTVPLPFCGVGFAGLTPEGRGTSNNKESEDHHQFDLLIVARDVRGSGYAVDAATALIDAVRSALIGHVLTGLSGVAPIKLGAVRPVASEPDKNVAAFVAEIFTWQVIQ